MPVSFDSIGTGTLKPAAPRTSGAGAGTGSGFTDSLKQSLGTLLDGVEETQGEANQAVTNMVNKTGEVHDAMIALQRAQMQLELTVTIRNKLVTAYQDIMRMPV
jgi:flagellar hook-basal body complex protein FliE